MLGIVTGDTLKYKGVQENIEPVLFKSSYRISTPFYLGDTPEEGKKEINQVFSDLEIDYSSSESEMSEEDCSLNSSELLDELSKSTFRRTVFLRSLLNAAMEFNHIEDLNTENLSEIISNCTEKELSDIVEITEDSIADSCISQNYGMVCSYCGEREQAEILEYYQRAKNALHNKIIRLDAGEYLYIDAVNEENPCYVTVRGTEELIGMVSYL